MLCVFASEQMEYFFCGFYADIHDDVGYDATPSTWTSNVTTTHFPRPRIREQLGCGLDIEQNYGKVFCRISDLTKMTM